MLVPRRSPTIATRASATAIRSNSSRASAPRPTDSGGGRTGSSAGWSGGVAARRGSDLNDRADLVEAGAAIDRAIQSRQKRHQGGGAALGARDLVQLARGFPLTLAAPIHPALMATLWLVEQSPFGKEGLLAGGEDEHGCAITTGQRFVLEAHLRSPPS